MIWKRLDLCLRKLTHHPHNHRRFVIHVCFDVHRWDFISGGPFTMHGECQTFKMMDTTPANSMYKGRPRLLPYREIAYVSADIASPTPPASPSSSTPTSAASSQPSTPRGSGTSSSAFPFAPGSLPLSVIQSSTSLQNFLATNGSASFKPKTGPPPATPSGAPNNNPPFWSSTPQQSQPQQPRAPLTVDVLVAGAKRRRREGVAMTLQAHAPSRVSPMWIVLRIHSFFAFPKQSPPSCCVRWPPEPVTQPPAPHIPPPLPTSRHPGQVVSSPSGKSSLSSSLRPSSQIRTRDLSGSDDDFNASVAVRDMSNFSVMGFSSPPQRHRAISTSASTNSLHSTGSSSPEATSPAITSSASGSFSPTSLPIASDESTLADEKARRNHFIDVRSQQNNDFPIIMKFKLNRCSTQWLADPTRPQTFAFGQSLSVSVCPGFLMLFFAWSMQ
jgi:hypothetical protein